MESKSKFFSWVVSVYLEKTIHSSLVLAIDSIKSIKLMKDKQLFSSYLKSWHTLIFYLSFVSSFVFVYVLFLLTLPGGGELNPPGRQVLPITQRKKF